MYYNFGKIFSGAWTGNLKHFYTRIKYCHSLVSNIRFTDVLHLIKLSVVIWSQYGSVSMWLGYMGWMTRGSIPDWGRDFSLVCSGQTDWDHISLLSNGNQGPFSWQESGRGPISWPFTIPSVEVKKVSCYTCISPHGCGKVLNQVLGQLYFIYYALQSTYPDTNTSKI